MAHFDKGKGSDRSLKMFAAHCATHGEWTRGIVDEEGCTRYLPACPRCVAEISARSALGRAEIPERYRDKSLDDYVATSKSQRRMLLEARTYVANFDSYRRTGTCRILIGKMGTGKTHIAMGIAKALIYDGFNVMFTSLPQILGRVHSNYASRGDNEMPLAILTAVDLLIVDEIGVQRRTADELFTLFRIFNARYERSLPSVIVTNLSIAELANCVGERIVDRFRENGGKVIVFDWSSFRGTSSEEEQNA